MCHEQLTAPVSGGEGLRQEFVSVPGDGQFLPSLLVYPEEGSAPGVVIVHDIWGANDFYHDVAKRLAGEGFAVLLPDFFIRQGALPEQTRDAAMARREQMDQVTALADISLSVAWLRDHPATTGQVGAVGFCMGGTLVMLAASEENGPNAVVAFYGFPAGTKGWPRRPLDEVASLRSPMLALWGDQDHGVGMDNVQHYRELADEAGKEVEIFVYPGLPHGFLTFDPDAPHFASARDAWSRAVTYLRDHLAL